MLPVAVVPPLDVALPVDIPPVSKDFVSPIPASDVGHTWSCRKGSCQLVREADVALEPPVRRTRKRVRESEPMGSREKYGSYSAGSTITGSTRRRACAQVRREQPNAGDESSPKGSAHDPPTLAPAVAATTDPIRPTVNRSAFAAMSAIRPFTDRFPRSFHGRLSWRDDGPCPPVRRHDHGGTRNGIQAGVGATDGTCRGS